MSGAKPNEGAWIFVSHSLRDWERVRQIRNMLEERGHKPLLFFLKCLNDDAEVDDLIRREIEARTWFVLCDSPNARDSRWVQAEIEIIKKLEGKVYEVIQLDSDIAAQVERVDALAKRATVFLSYRAADRLLVAPIEQELRRHDYALFDLDAFPSNNFVAAIHQGIDDATRRGFFIPLLTPEFLQSNYAMEELRYALEKAAQSRQGANIVPVVIRDFSGTLNAIAGSIALPLTRMHWFDFTTGSFPDRMRQLIHHLKTFPME